MGVEATLVLYAVLGAGVAAAVFVRSGREDATHWFEITTAAVFWPLYVPMLLGRSDAELIPRSADASEGDPLLPDELEEAIAQAESELDVALTSLDGWAEQTLAAETGRLKELRQAWRLQATRIRELTHLLQQSFVESNLAGSEKCTSETARRANLRRLDDLREKMRTDLLGTIAWVRELVTLIHLARYTGAPASRAADLVAQIAAAVEGLHEVTELQTLEPPTAA